MVILNMKGLLTMISKYIEKLEYSAILDKLSSFCITDYGKILSLNLQPSSNKKQVLALLNETSEAMNLLQIDEPPISNIVNIDYIIKILNSNGVLSLSAILELNKILKVSSALKDYFCLTPNITNFPICNEYFSKLYINPTIVKKIENCIVDENTVADSASTKLHSIRNSMRKIEDNIKDKLNYILHSASFSKYVQENVITIRNNRYVIPIKDEYRSSIKGFIHDISASGSTVFIEPMTIFELNNELHILQAEEKNEIEKILVELSSLLAPYTKELEENYKTIGTIDFIFAKAKYAIELDAILPKISEQKQINLIGARHPLISKDTVVPINIELGKSFSSLIITGPNTGGKTVTLKTTGLLCLMACSGLFIPAKPESSIYVFDKIYADIGDEQSIVESLSTFSSHMSNIIEILNNSTSESLILLDELGSGTDPVEGSSLAISILETFYKKGALTISTSHYSELKDYALITDGFENASQGFDLENLKPTYQLLIGIPGRSNAFSISKKLGLDSKIIDRAKSFLDDDQLHIEELLKNIYDNKLLIEKEKEEITKNSNQVLLLRKSLEEEQKTLNEKSNSYIEKAKQDARKILQDAKEQASYYISQMDDIYENASSTSTKELNQIRNTLNSKIKETATNITTEKNESSVSKDEITVGCKVYISALNQEGTVLTLPNKAQQIQVQIGSAKLMVPISNISKILNTSKETFSGTSSYKISKAKTATTEINVIGYNVDEAIFVIDKYIDDCALAKLKTIRIVHGKGTGTLRRGIHNYLKTNSHVSSFRLGTFGEGETGVTVVELK
jgi:DNA mismatch repair protein MutS2